MNRILSKVRLSPEVFRIEVDAPLIARARKPGQFVILMLDDDYAERIPLTIADADPERGVVTLIFQTVGASTHRLAFLEPGDSVAALLGPLGNPTHIEKFGTVVCVGGGIGIAPLYPIAQGMKAAGNRLIVIIGARTRELVLMEDEFSRIADELIIVTDDGSYGRTGLVTGPLGELCRQTPKPDLVVAIGPAVMMKFCAETTRPGAIRTIVSLNTIMIDGTGMCGGCRVTVGGQTRFVCVDGPEFDGHAVDFDVMINRLSSYRDQEQEAHHRCHLDLGIETDPSGRAGPTGGSPR